MQDMAPEIMQGLPAHIAEEIVAAMDRGEEEFAERYIPRTLSDSAERLVKAFVLRSKQVAEKTADGSNDTTETFRLGEDTLVISRAETVALGAAVAVGVRVGWLLRQAWECKPWPAGD